MRNLSLILLIASTCALSACTLEDETKEKVIEKEPVKVELTAEEQFVKDARECIAGKTELAPELLDTYFSSYDKDNPDSTLLYQHHQPTRAFERCALKVATEGDNSLTTSIISNPQECARIAQKFYAVDDEENGAFWSRRVINLEGQAHGYEILGNAFITDDKTLAIGARLLSEAALLGNLSARIRLNTLSSSSTALDNND